MRVQSFLVLLRQSSCCLSVRVGLPRCQIWDSLPRLLRLEKCGAWHGLDCFQWLSCMAQIFRRKARMGHRAASWVCPSMSHKKDKWRLCKTSSSLGYSLHCALLGQSCHTMGEMFLDPRCDLLPDVCLATRALGHRVTALNEYSDRNVRQCYCWNS